MSAVTIEHSELPDVHEPHLSEHKEAVGEPSLPTNESDRDPSGSSEALEAECKYQGEDNSTPVRSIIIGEDDEEDGETGSTKNTQEDIDPYKDYDAFLYDHDYTGMFRPAHIPKIIEEGYDPVAFPIMAGLSSHFADEEFDEQQSSGSRNMIYNGETSSSLYRFREFQPRQGDIPIERGHGIHPTTSYRLSSNSVVYGGKTLMRYSSLAGSQAFRTPVRDSFVSSPSSPRAIASYGTARRISLSGGNVSNVTQRKTLRSRFGERTYEQPGLRVMPSPAKQFASESPSLYQSNTASFVADPMRAANDNAPAPFIVPARGSRPSLRGKGQANRSQQTKGKAQDMEEKHAKSENLLQIGAIRGQHPGRIYESQVETANSNKNYVSNTFVEPNHVPQAEFICQPYQQNVEDDSRLHLPTTSAAQNMREPVVVGMESEQLRAESPVTSIVESAHREAVNRASESAQTGDSLGSVKVLVQSAQELQHSGYPVNEGDQSFEGEQQPRFQNYVTYEQQQMDYYNEGSQEQCTATGEQQYFVEEEQRQSVDERYDPPPQRRRLSSRSSSYSSYNENTTTRIGNSLHSRVRRGRQTSLLSNQSPLDSHTARQLPLSPNHASGVFGHPEEKPIQSDSHVSVQSGLVQTVPSQQQRMQLVSAVPSTPSVMSHAQEPGARPIDHSLVQQTLQHAQLSSPEQQIPLSEQQFMQPLLTEPIANNSNLNVHRNYGYIMITQDRPDSFVQRFRQQSFVNEEASSGDEMAVTNSAQSQGYNGRRIQDINMRSSVSAAEEETSFAEDPSEERGTEEEEQRTQKDVVASTNKIDEYDGWSEGDEYTTRCYCTLSHNDDFMIQCDVCNVWQHMVCMGVDRNRVPKVYKCEKCNPRLLKLSVAEAKAKQLNYLEMKKRRKIVKPKVKKVDQKSRRKPVSKAKERKNVVDGPSKKFVETNVYDYSRTVAAFAKRQKDTGNISILDSIKNNETLRVMYVAQDSEGLVSTRSFHKGEPVVFVCGRLCMPSECPGREKPGSVIPFVMLYSIHLEEQGAAPITICIDARRAGSTARFARRSCKPNVRLQHIFSSGKLYIFGIATEDVERGDEITLPFDPDYALAKKKLVCACAPDEESAGSDSCEIRKLGSALEESSTVVRVELDKKICASEKKNSTKVMMKSKKFRKTKEKDSRFVKASGKCDNADNRITGQSGSSESKPIGKSSVLSGGHTGNVAALTMTDEESMAPHENGVLSSNQNDSTVQEKSIVNAVLKPSKSKKGTSVALKAASQKRKGAIKLKRRARKASLRSKPMSKKRLKNDTEGISSSNERSTANNGEILMKIRTRLSFGAPVPSTVQPIKIGEIIQCEEKSNMREGLKEENCMAMERKADDVGNVNKTENGPVNEMGVNYDDQLLQPGVTVKAEVPEMIGKDFSEQVEVLDTKNSMKAELETTFDNVPSKIENVSTLTIRGKRKSATEIEKDVITANKKAKEEISKTSDTETVSRKDKEVKGVSMKKASHHRKELPEVEVMNYMLPGDRNKTETREERKMRQQLALFERMQKENKKKEERRQKFEATAEKKLLEKSGLKIIKTEESEVSKKLARQEKLEIHQETVESKDIEKSLATSPARRSARVSERDQEKEKFIENTAATEAAIRRLELEKIHANPVPHHPAFLTAPRKRWAAAARSDSLESNSVTSATSSTPVVCAPKSYLLRRIEQQDLPATVKDSGLEINSTVVDQEPKSYNPQEVSPAKKRRGTESPPLSVEMKQKFVSSTPLSHGVADVKAECFPNPEAALSTISEASKELAACYAQMCAMTSELGVVDFLLPFKEFSKRDSGFDSQSSSTETLPLITSTSIGKTNTISPKKPQKKKMSLDEYKKRKETSSVVSDEKSEEGATSSKSFIPTIRGNDFEVVTRRASLRLGSIPDPAQLRDAPTASFDDLKRRIYGKPSLSNSSRSPKALIPLNQSRCRTPPETAESSSHRSASSQPKPSPPPPPPPPLNSSRSKSEQKEARLPLEERLQMLLGGTDPALLTNSSVLRPPPPPPPPSLPPVSVHTRASSRKAEVVILPSTVRGRTPPPPPIYGSSGLHCRSRRH